MNYIDAKLFSFRTKTHSFIVAAPTYQDAWKVAERFLDDRNDRLTLAGRSKPVTSIGNRLLLVPMLGVSNLAPGEPGFGSLERPSA